MSLHRRDAAPTTPHRSAVYAALVWERQIAFCDRFPQRGVHQLVDVKLHGFSGVGRQVQNSGVHPDGVLRAYLDTVPAIDTDTQVDVEADRILLNVWVGMLTGHDGDALGGANRLARSEEHTSELQ